MEFFAGEKESITDVKMPTFQDSGRCVGYAHVMFKSKNAYEAALQKSGQRLGGRYLDIKEAQGSAKPEPSQSQEMAELMPADCKTLFVKGLPYNFKEDDIGDRFRRFGEIKGIRIATNWQTKESKGFAYIQFETHESAKNALIKMNGKEVQGRYLKVDYDSKAKPKSSYKINTDTTNNRLYNRDPIKQAKSKIIKKEREKIKLEKLRKHSSYH